MAAQNGVLQASIFAAGDWSMWLMSQVVRRNSIVVRAALPSLAVRMRRSRATQQLLPAENYGSKALWLDYALLRLQPC